MSIKKIAEKAGVSPATVSRVLNNPNYKCSVPGLRDKIWKTAIEMNYVPNEAARNLKRGVSAKQEKTWYINILMTRTDSSTTDPFFAELLRVIKVRSMIKTASFPKYGTCRYFLMTGSAAGKIWTG